jgi:hypothetical protein
MLSFASWAIVHFWQVKKFACEKSSPILGLVLVSQAKLININYQ